jgi:hypothetical protein
MSQFLFECYVVQIQISVLAPSDCIKYMRLTDTAARRYCQAHSAPKTRGMNVQIHVLK